MRLGQLVLHGWVRRWCLRWLHCRWRLWRLGWRDFYRRGWCDRRWIRRRGWHVNHQRALLLRLVFCCGRGEFIEDGHQRLSVLAEQKVFQVQREDVLVRIAD